MSHRLVKGWIEKRADSEFLSQSPLYLFLIAPASLSTRSRPRSRTSGRSRHALAPDMEAFIAQGLAQNYRLMPKSIYGVSNAG